MPNKIQVVIVGGGPVGLSMAILLQRFGIDFVLLERNATTTDHPKARGTYTRTMEIFRQWGIDGMMKRHALPDGSDFFSFCESMTGHEWGPHHAGAEHRPLALLENHPVAGHGGSGTAGPRAQERGGPDPLRPRVPAFR